MGGGGEGQGLTLGILDREEGPCDTHPSLAQKPSPALKKCMLSDPVLVFYLTLLRMETKLSYRNLH